MAYSLMPGSAIGTVERIVSALPQPKKKPVKKPPPIPEEDVVPGEKPKPKAKPKVEEPVKKPPIPETNESALESAVSWQNF